MMRHTRTPHEGCGRSRGPCRRRKVAGWERLAVFAILVALFAFGGGQAFAQDPSVLAPKTPSDSSFGDTNISPQLKIDQSQPLYLQADELIYDTDGDSVIARGNVEIYYNNYILTSDEVVYNQSAGTLTAVGNVTVKEPNGSILRADRYTLTDDFRDGFVQSLSIVAKDDSRIAAERAIRREGNVTEFVNGRFTPCKSQGGMPPLWCISAARVVHNQQDASITYYDAQFEVFGVPILYTPYFQHADPSVKRKSGFLMPEVGSSDAFGFSTTVPYYFALAPNYDFTFYPQYMTRQGVLWQGDWRHRLANGQYSVKLAGIDQDAGQLPSEITDREEFDGWRGSIETKGLFSLSSWWKTGWDVTVESDDAFRRFYKLDNILLTDRVNRGFLIGQSERNYFGLNVYQLGGLLFNDQPESDSWVHPVIDYNYVAADPILGGELRWNTNVLSLSRDNEDVGSGQESLNRVVTEVKWRKRLTDHIGITYTPFGELRGDIYQLKDYNDPQAGSLGSGSIVDGSTSLARGLAFGGVTVAYPWVANSSRGSHVIEPIGQIIGRQNSVRQRDLPDEDAQSLVFDDTNLFETTKFSGYDRIETGSRANVGVQYTFQANSGGYIRVLGGQSFHLSGDNPYANPGFDQEGNPVFTPNNGLDTDRSDYVLGAYVAPSDFFRVISQSRFNEDDLALRRQDTTAIVGYGPFYATGTYSYEANALAAGFTDAQQDVLASLNMAITQHWSVKGGLRYDVDEGEMLQNLIQIRYGDECFVLTATYTENRVQIDEVADGSTVMLRFELKHLGEFGYKTDALDYAFSEQQSGG